MSDIVVKSQFFYMAINNLNNYSTSISRQINKMRTIRNHLPFEMQNSMTVRANLDAIISELAEEKKRLKDASTALENILIRYVNTERDVNSLFAGKGVAVKWADSGTGSSTKKDSSKKTEDKNLLDISDFWNIVAEFGIIGAFGAAFGDFMTMQTDTNADVVKKYLNFIKTGNKGFGRVVEAAGKADWAKRLIGMNHSEAKSFTEAWKSEWGKYSVKENKAIGISKRFGALLTFGVNACDNYNEFDGKITTRSVSETVLETGIDLAKGAAATALVTAAIGGAPAVAIGAGVVAVTWAADAAFEAITGKDFTETVSDFALDFVEDPLGQSKKVVQSVGKAKKWIGTKINEGISNAGKSVKKFGESIAAGWRLAFN